MFDWPSSPVENQVYTPPGGPQYIYKAPAWRVNMPPSAVITDYWRRNRLVNGAMQISQENGSNTMTANMAYAADQWIYFQGGFTGGSATRVSGALTPSGNAYSLGLVVSTNKPTLAVGDYAIMWTPIEGRRVEDFQWGTALAKQVILRFWVYGSLAGNYSVTIRNAVPNRSWCGLFNLAAGDLSKFVERSFVIPGDTLGVWPKDTTKGMDLAFCLAAHATGTYTSTATGWNAGNYIATVGQSNGSGGSLYISDVGLYLDAANTGVAPRWEMPDEAEELRACQRYYERIPITSVTAANLQYQGWGYKAQKRIVSPALAITGGSANGATFGIIAHDGSWGLRQLTGASAAADIMVSSNARF